MTDETHAGPTGIPGKRLQAYARLLEHTDVPRLAAVIVRTRGDLETLREEGRKRAAQGAGNLLANLVRRLGYTMAVSKEQAMVKIGLLEDVLALYQDGGQPLMAAIVGAALGFERERWPTG